MPLTPGLGCGGLFYLDDADELVKMNTNSQKEASAYNFNEEDEEEESDSDASETNLESNDPLSSEIASLRQRYVWS